MSNDFLNKLNIPKNNHAYFKHLKQFLDIYYPNDVDYNVSFKSLINDPQMEYRYICFSNIDIFDGKIKNVSATCDYETMLCVFDNYPHVEFILKNTINKLSANWCHTVICCPVNEILITEICKKISNNIKIVCLTKNIVTFQDRNALFISPLLWSLSTAKKILIYDEQSCILKNNYKSFINYDFIGAPWKHATNSKKVGNGSFSLRTRSVMLDIVSHYSPRDIHYENEEINEHIQQKQDYLPPEDVFFTTCMINNEIGLIPNVDIAKIFSVESVMFNAPFGIHECYLANPTNWRSYLYENIINASNNYIFDAKRWVPLTPFTKELSIERNYSQFEIYCGNCVLKINNEKEFERIINNTFSTQIGFIVTRHVSNEKNARYWHHCYKCIREYYPFSRIVIIDDHSNYKYINMSNVVLENTIVINSTLANKCGEFLPYFYFAQYNFFEKGVILHDGMFVNKYMDFSVHNNIFLFEFYSEIKNYEDYDSEQVMLNALSHNGKLVDLHNKPELWKGCFGSCSVITHSFAHRLEKKYKLSILQNYIKTRKNRSEFERIIAILFYVEKQFENKLQSSLFGSIFDHYKQFEYTFDEYLLNGEQLIDYGVIKVWSGR